MKKLYLLSLLCLLVLAVCLLIGCDKETNCNCECECGGGISMGYVDLGLPSGTKWKNMNETNADDDYDFYTYDEAVRTFGDSLPNYKQFRELLTYCTWTWQDNGYDNGYKVTGPNGNYIFLPALGYRLCDTTVHAVKVNGIYWSSTIYDTDCGWSLTFYSEYHTISYDRCCSGFSVRLVQN